MRSPPSQLVSILPADLAHFIFPHFSSTLVADFSMPQWFCWGTFKPLFYHFNINVKLFTSYCWVFLKSDFWIIKQVWFYWHINYTVFHRKTCEFNFFSNNLFGHFYYAFNFRFKLSKRYIQQIQNCFVLYVQGALTNFIKYFNWSKLLWFTKGAKYMKMKINQVEISWKWTKYNSFTYI